MGRVPATNQFSPTRATAIGGSTGDEGAGEGGRYPPTLLEVGPAIFERPGTT
jgi:hypothetical protein